MATPHTPSSRICPDCGIEHDTECTFRDTWAGNQVTRIYELECPKCGAEWEYRTIELPCDVHDALLEACNATTTESRHRPAPRSPRPLSPHNQGE